MLRRRGGDGTRGCYAFSSMLPTRMSWRRWTTALLVVALLALGPIAHASPLDPTWIAGFWDDSDHDNVVILVTSMASAADTHLALALVPVLVVASVATLKPASFSAGTFSPTASRAPPSTRNTHHSAL